MKESKQVRLLAAMMEFDRGDAKRIQHFLKVWAFAKMIGESEGVDEQTQFTLETAAIVHDIGIHACEEKYGHTAGKQQESEGAPLAEDLLRSLGYEEAVCRRAAWLVGHHHTYDEVEGIDHQILLEADFLVNSYEDSLQEEAIRSFCRKVFRTASGIKLLELQFGLSLSQSFS